MSEPQQIKDIYKGYKPSQIDMWPYVTTNGFEFYYIRPKGKGSRGWRSHINIKDTIKPLTIDAITLTQPIFIVEGERTRDALMASGFNNVTCGQGGCKNLKHQDWSMIINAHVILCPDDDDGGYEYMADLSDILDSQKCHIKWLNIDTIQIPDTSFTSHNQTHDELYDESMPFSHTVSEDYAFA